MTPRDRSTLAAGLAVLLASASLQPLFVGTGWLAEVAGGVGVVVLAGLVARRAGLPAVLQPLAGLLTLLGYTLVVFAGSTLAVVLPTTETVTTLRALIEGGREDISVLVAPVPTNDGLVLLAVLAVGSIAVLVDTVAVVAGRAAVAGLPLLLLFAAPPAIADRSVGWVPFALAAVGWLLMLLVEGGQRVGRWGTPLRASARGSGAPGGLGAAGSRIGVAALGLAIAVPVLLPTVGEGLVGTGEGDDGGPRSVTTYNPLTRLSGELNLPATRDVLRYTTDDEDPDYIRMTTLSLYDGSGWKQAKLEGSLRDDGVEDRIPTPVGVADDAPSTIVRSQFDIATLDAYWLPLPATPTDVNVAGPWLWDAASQSVFATRSDTSEVGVYDVVSRRIRPDADLLNASASAPLPAEIAPYTEPIEATPGVQELTSRITAGAQTPYDRAVAIQSYFRDPAKDLDPDRDFTYDETTGSNVSPDALQSFLENKQGFCEQYSSAMAAMLRLSGIPSRVAVGFTPGTRQPDASYLVTTDEGHAWPEAWFAGAGWVRFEPTPGIGSAPEFAPSGPGPGEPSAAPSATPSATPNPTASADANDTETPAEREARLEAEREAAAAATPTGTGGGGDGGPPFALLLAALPVAALLVAPAATHRVRTRARWQAPGAAAAWEQVCEDAADVGLPVDLTRSPRQVLARLSATAGLTGPAAAGLARISDVVERDRYARPGTSDPTDLRATTDDVRAGLRARLTRGERVRGALLPPAVLRWVGRSLSDLSGRLSETTGRIRLPARLRRG